MAKERQVEDGEKAGTKPGLKLEVNTADCLRVIEQQEAQITRLRLENVVLVRMLNQKREEVSTNRESNRGSEE